LDGSEAQYAVTLSPNLISSELSITNNSSSPRHITGCILNHLKASTPDATYLIGMQCSSYFTCEPIMSEFAISLPSASKTGMGWAEKGLDGLFGKRIGDISGKIRDEGEEIEEESNYVHMTEESSQFYQNTPREFTVLDRVSIYICWSSPYYQIFADEITVSHGVHNPCEYDSDPMICFYFRCNFVRSYKSFVFCHN
jgi:hypothetical protein